MVNATSGTHKKDKYGQFVDICGQNFSKTTIYVCECMAVLVKTKTFSPNQKICHKSIWQKLERKKVVSKFEGVDFYRKFYENSTPTAYSLRGSTLGGRSGLHCTALPGVDRKAAKPFEMAACSSCNALHVVDIGRICKAFTTRFWANLHSLPGAACTGLHVSVAACLRRVVLRCTSLAGCESFHRRRLDCMRNRPTAWLRSADGLRRAALDRLTA